MNKSFDKNNLIEVLDYIHDMKIDLSTIAFDDGNLKVDLIRKDYNSKDCKASRFLFFFKIRHCPKILSRLIFKEVNSYNIIDDQKIVIYTLNDFNINNKLLTINFCERTKLHIEFNSCVHLELKDIKTIEE